MSHGGLIAHCLELMRPWGRLAIQAAQAEVAPAALRGSHAGGASSTTMRASGQPSATQSLPAGKGKR